MPVTPDINPYSPTSMCSLDNIKITSSSFSIDELWFVFIDSFAKTLTPQAVLRGASDNKFSG